MKRRSKKSSAQETISNLIGLGKSSIQKSYYPQLQKKIKELEESEKKYRLLAENISDVIWMTDMNLCFTFISPSIEGLSGYKVTEIIQKNIKYLLTNDSYNYIKKNFKEELKFSQNWTENYSRKFELQLKNKDESLTWIETIASIAYDDDGNPSGILGVSRDISERIIAEEEKKKIREQLTQAQKMESIGTLAGGIAHDFNNLLTIINGYSEMALMRLSKNDPLYEDLNSIRDAGQRAELLTGQLLAFSRKQVYKPEIVQPNQIIKSLEKMLRRLIDEDIKIEIKLNPKIPNIKADKSQLEQIFINLMVNARDAIREHSKKRFRKKITIETGVMDLDQAFVKSHPGSHTGEYVYFSVKDNGTGMDKLSQQKIFEPFYTTKEKDKGTGLGLSMVYGIIKQNNGQIELISEPGKGSKFIIYWPSTKDKRTNTDLVFFDDNLNGSENILIVEDDLDVCRFASQSLQSLGYKVVTAENGKKALEIIKSNDHTFDLIITDLIMPELNGREFIYNVQRILPDVKVIYVSGYTDDQIAPDGSLEENISFIQKPYSVITLAKTTRHVLDTN